MVLSIYLESGIRAEDNVTVTDPSWQRYLRTGNKLEKQVFFVVVSIVNYIMHYVLICLYTVNMMYLFIYY